MGLPYVSVIYEEWKPETYQGIKIQHETTEELINTGNFMADWLTVQQKIKYFNCSSTVDNFMKDMVGGEIITDDSQKQLKAEYTNSSFEFHACEEAKEVYNLIQKESNPYLIGFTTPGWYLHIEDNGAWSKINYCPYCGEELR